MELVRGEKDRGKESKEEGQPKVMAAEELSAVYGSVLYPTTLILCVENLCVSRVFTSSRLNPDF